MFRDMSHATKNPPKHHGHSGLDTVAIVTTLLY